MDSSHNFPPSPRDMYMYRPAQQINGHKVQSPSPSRGRPPPILPERKPETQLSNRTSRSSVTSRGSSSSDVASPPLSPAYVGHGQHSPQFHNQSPSHYPDNKPFAYVAGINAEPTVKAHNLTESNIRSRMDRDASPQNRRGTIRNDGHVSNSDRQRFARDEDYGSDVQNEGAVYQRIDRNRASSSPDRSFSGDLGYHQGGTFHSGNNLRHSEGIYGQFVEPSSGSQHRPSLTYVPPPVVPTMQPDHMKVDKGIAKEHHHHHHQKQQHKVKPPSIPAPPPLPPTRTSSTSQSPTNHYQDLNPAPPGIKSSCSGSPARLPGALPHSLKQPSLATLDDLVQVKLRAVTDGSSSLPHSPLVSPVATGDSSPGPINVRLRPTPGKFRNIYTEDASTLPPPPPIDDLDELPPPPPPPELLCDDPAPLNVDSTTHRSILPPSSHLQTGDPDSSQIDPASQRQRLATNSPQKTHSSGSEAGSRSGGISGALEGASSSLEQLILESVSNMDFEIPNDIDLSQCPGLVEINKSTPNWKKDMIEKKNQERIEEYVKKILKEREHEAKWKNVPDWKRKILQKKEEEDGIVVSPPQEVKPAPGKKPAKKAPVPPPKEAKEDVTSSKPKIQFPSQNDIVPAALSIDPEELAAMPPWKRELLFKRDKVPVTFSNEFNPDDENENLPAS